MFLEKGDFARNLLLTVVTLNVAFEFFLDLGFGQVRKDHFHLNFLVGILGKTLPCSEILFLCVNDSRLGPDLDVLISGIKDINVHVIGPATVGAFLVDSNEFFENVAS